MLDDIIEALMVRPAPRDPEAERAWREAAEAKPRWTPPSTGEPLPPPRDAPPWTPRPWHPVDEIEVKLLTAIDAGDDASREVYADWLEGQGDSERAELLRVQELLRTTPPIADEFDDRLRRMRELERRVDPQWRARIHRAIDVPFSVEFPKHLYARRTDHAPASTTEPQAHPMVLGAIEPRATAPSEAVVRGRRRRAARRPTAAAPPAPVYHSAMAIGFPTWMMRTSQLSAAILGAVLVLYWLGLVG